MSHTRLLGCSDDKLLLAVQSQDSRQSACGGFRRRHHETARGHEARGPGGRGQPRRPGLRRFSRAGAALHDPRAPGPHPAAHRPGQRSLPPAASRPSRRMAGPRALLRRRFHRHAAHPGGPRALPRRRQTSRWEAARGTRRVHGFGQPANRTAADSRRGADPAGGMGRKAGPSGGDDLLRRPHRERGRRRDGHLRAHREARLEGRPRLAPVSTGGDSGMTRDRWRRVNELFHAAREMPETQREDYLCGECGDDTGLVSEVRGMLREDSQSGMLDRPPVTPPPSESVFSPGQMVSGRYRIVRFLGRGGMGEVFEAEDCELKGRVALKTLLPLIASDGRMLARFKQEIQLSRKVSHPNVCRVFDLARHPADAAADVATVFLTMEFLDGETLAERLRREGRMSPAEALPLLAQMAEALDAAHRAGVIHRDFKPSNVMLVPSGEGLRAVVTDFGLARSFTTSGETTATLTGNMMGTLDYMAPELMSGGSASIASDVYAFGATAYKMITGALPFPSETPLAGAIRRAKDPAPSPRTLVPDLDPRWEQAILRALDPAPERRFSRAGHLVRILQGETPSMSIRIPVMTRRRVIAGVAAALVLIGGAVGWWQWQRSRNQPSPEGLRWYQTGTAALRDATYFRAARALERSVSIDPGFALAHARLAESWNELDDSERAMEEMLRALATQS